MISNYQSEAGLEDFFKLVPAFKDDPRFAIIEIQEVVEFSGKQYLTLEGKKLKQGFTDEFEFRAIQKGEFPPILGNNFGWVITRGDITDEISNTELAKGLQFIPLSAQLNSAFKESVPKFFLWNVLNVWDCLDEGLSELRYSNNDIGESYISAVYKYVFDFSRTAITEKEASKIVFRASKDPYCLFTGNFGVKEIETLDIFEIIPA